MPTTIRRTAGTNKFQFQMRRAFAGAHVGFCEGFNYPPDHVVLIIFNQTFFIVENINWKFKGNQHCLEDT